MSINITLVKSNSLSKSKILVSESNAVVSESNAVVPEKIFGCYAKEELFKTRFSFEIDNVREIIKFICKKKIRVKKSAS